MYLSGKLKKEKKKREKILNLNLNVKGTMFKIVTVLLVILVQITGVYAFHASETSSIEEETSELSEEESSKLIETEVKNETNPNKANMELIVNNSSANSEVLPGRKLTYTITLNNENALPMSNLKLKVDTDKDDTTGLIRLVRVKDKAGKVVSESGVTIDKDTINIKYLPANEIYSIEYAVNAVSPGYNDNTDFTNSVSLVSSDQRVSLSADSVLSSNVSKKIAETNIYKIFDESQRDGKLVPGETVYYAIDIDAFSTGVAAHNVNIRDSLLENLPDFATYNDDLKITATLYDGYNYVDVDAPMTVGDLRNGDFMIEDLPANTYVRLLYSIRVNAIPDGTDSIYSVVTADGRDPIDAETGMPIVCAQYPNADRNCSYAFNIACETQSPNPPNIEKNGLPDIYSICLPVMYPLNSNGDPMKAKTEINKSLTETNVNGVTDIGETIEYKIDIVNNGTVPAYNTVVRDSMLENLPDFVTFNDDVAITEDIMTSGQLTAGDFNIESIPAGSTVSITYSIQVNETPAEVAELSNIATQGGNDPQICSANDENCSEVLLPLHPLEIIEGNETISDVIVDEIPTETNSEVVSEVVNESNEVVSDIVENENKIEYINNENKLELISEALSANELSLEKATLNSSKAVANDVNKITSTGGLEIIILLFLANIGTFFVVLKKTV